ncbi:MAG: transposase, partial [Flavobacteriales bacterium]|nr:transposase [Flavobacteriales bacterium]
QFPEFKIPSSQVLQEVVRQVDREYKSFFQLRKNGDKDVRPPRFRASKYFYTHEYPQNKTSFTTEGGVLKLAYGKGRKDWISIPLDVTVPGVPKTVKIMFDRKKRSWWACISYMTSVIPEFQKSYAIYFDPGCKTTLTGIKTDGTFIEYDIESLRATNMSTYKFLDKLASRRDKKTRHSNSWKRLNKRIQKGFSKLETRTKTHLHALANKILADHWDTTHFLIGDWKKKETLADTGNKYVNKIINRAVQNNNPIGRLVEYLKYKAKRFGKTVDKFNERGTTRTCVMCGHVHKKGIPPSVRVFECKACDFKYDRDRHSCLNFVKLYEPALWKRLRNTDLIRSRVRTGFSAFSFKPWVATESKPSNGIPFSPASHYILTTGCTGSLTP